MKLSLNWIKDYVQLPDDFDLKKLAYDLTMSTVEVEDAIDLSKQFNNMVVGQILELNPHPNADKLTVCKTDIGDGEPKDIVCGGINLRVGMKVLVAKPGAICRWHGQGEPVEIKNAKLRGVPSYGMICASSEVGLYDLFPFDEEQAIIMDLSAFDAPAGTPIADALDLNDIILEIDNKSMTHRPDLWGHYGVAREIAGLYDLPLAKFEKFECDVQSDFHVEVRDLERCPRYNAAQIEGLYVKPAPYKMQCRIWKTGMRPINALVDITNYVMLATGQPTHAFDADNIEDHIVVRRAEPDEKLLLLNSKELNLSTDDLVIADVESAVGLAGVMGGKKDSVLPKTNRVILEVANFTSAGIRRTAQRHENRTDAAARYEKAIDPERCDQAMALAMQLFKEQYPEMSISGYTDIYPEPLKCTEIDVSLNWLARRLGKTIDNETLQAQLSRIGFTVSFDGDNMHVVSPTWRSTGDISIKADIMEEVARLYGYENFEAAPITTTFMHAINQVDEDLERKLKEYLAFRCGMQEVFTYPWMNQEYIDAILQTTDNMLALSTPPSQTEKYIKASLLPNLVKAVVKNQYNYSEFSIFECSQIFKDADWTTPYDEREKLPYQHRNIAGAFVGSSDASAVTALFRRAKGVVENMPRYTHMEGFTFKQVQKPVWANDVVWLNIYLGEEKVGNLALMAHKAAIECGVKDRNVMLFELDVEALKPFTSRTNAFTHLPEYPMTEYDVSLLFDVATKWEDMYPLIVGKKSEENLLREAYFVDEYRGKQIPAGKKSVTIRLLIGSLSKTLTSKEIEDCANAVIKKLVKKLKAETRA